MKLLFVFCLWFVVYGFLLAQSRFETREEKLQQLKSRSEIKVTEIQKDILKLEYPNGKVLYKNIANYQEQPSSIKYPVKRSPTYDSTIIDLTTIDTTLYYQKYSFWQEVPIHNSDYDYVRIGDVNKNGRPELYGSRKLFQSDYEPITVYELNETGKFEEIYQYDSVYLARNIYDIDNDEEMDLHLTLPPILGTGTQQRFFSKETDTSLATRLNFIYIYGTGAQLDDQTLGDFDGDSYTDLLFDRFNSPYFYILEYNSVINNFDSVYRFDVNELPPYGIGGYSVGDFDLDDKTDIVFSTGRGNVFVVENEGDNQYVKSWQGSVESNNAYVHTWTNDIDMNGKPEFWVLADAYYNGIGTTRITLFETNEDNSYQAAGRIDLVGIFSFYAGNMQAVDIDGDGTEEVAVCIDQNFLILKFNGSEDHQTYEVYYIKQNELATDEVSSEYYGAIMYDLLSDGRKEILISMNHTIFQQNITRRMTRIYKPDSLTSVLSDDGFLPNSIVLYQNYPNPFNPATNIRVILQEPETVSLKVYDILGKEIKLLLKDELPAGEHTVQWDGKDNKGNLLPGGIYFIQLTAGKYRQAIKSVLLK